jgi:DNA modification methylase
VSAEWRILQGDSLERLREMGDESVHCVITSPPYFGLRDYGTAVWEGGDAACEHVVGGQVADSKAPGAISSGIRPGADAWTCRLCGAHRRDHQLGLEATPEQYVEALVEVFREVRRVLRSDGVCWLNLGDSYAGARGGGQGKNSAFAGRAAAMNGVRRREVDRIAPGVKPKDLIGIPWMVAFALRADGWWLRTDDVWFKPNTMPESVKDRTTRAHEYLFMLTRSGDTTFWTHRDGRGTRTRPAPDWRWVNVETREEMDVEPPDVGAEAQGGGRRWRRVNLWSGCDYYYDDVAIREEDSGRPSGNGFVREERISYGGRGKEEQWTPGGGRNKRSVWTVPTQPYAEAHFATFPERLIEPMVLAGSAPKTCGVCGAPWMRRSHVEIDDSRPLARRHIVEPQVTQEGQGTNAQGSSTWGHYTRTITDGWCSTCEHNDDSGRAVVLDPFAGAATTLKVAVARGRDAVGIELSEKYVAMAERRLQGVAAPLFAEW